MPFSPEITHLEAGSALETQLAPHLLPVGEQGSSGLSAIALTVANQPQWGPTVPKPPISGACQQRLGSTMLMWCGGSLRRQCWGCRGAAGGDRLLSTSQCRHWGCYTRSGEHRARLRVLGHPESHVSSGCSTPSTALAAAPCAKGTFSWLQDAAQPCCAFPTVDVSRGTGIPAGNGAMGAPSCCEQPGLGLCICNLGSVQRDYLWLLRQQLCRASPAG